MTDSLTSILASLPPVAPGDLLPEIRRLVAGDGRKIVVLDDDPTGTQTVQGVAVLTEWSHKSIEAELRDPGSVFYILTNSRALPREAACSLNREVAFSLAAAAHATGREFVVASRSDSTLRGHYPAEVRALSEGLGREFDATLIVPFFLEGGRYTIGDVHFVADGDALTPAGETEYARDRVFGYSSSNLREWVSEKHGGAVQAAGVASISLDEIRLGGPEVVRARLAALSDNRPCVVNAASYRDLEVLVLGLLRAEAEGRRFLYRTASSFVRVRAGLPAGRPLTAAALVAATGHCHGMGGLIVAGSYVGRSSEQIAALASVPNVESIEIRVPRLVDEAARLSEIEGAAARCARVISAGRHALVYTSRALLAGATDAENLRIGQAVSQGLVEIVSAIGARPAWMIAKGGITSSDLATRALGIRRAMVLGQSIPGVPVWQAGPESRWPGLVYVVFPGNVGGPDALARMVGMLDAGSGHAATGRGPDALPCAAARSSRAVRSTVPALRERSQRTAAGQLVC